MNEEELKEAMRLMLATNALMQTAAAQHVRHIEQRLLSTVSDQTLASELTSFFNSGNDTVAQIRLVRVFDAIAKQRAELIAIASALAELAATLEEPKPENVH